MAPKAAKDGGLVDAVEGLGAAALPGNAYVMSLSDSMVFFHSARLSR